MKHTCNFSVQSVNVTGLTPALDIGVGRAIILRSSGNSSVGRAQPCQGWGREFESRFPLSFFQVTCRPGWQSGYAAACKAVDAGSIPTPAFEFASKQVRCTRTPEK